TRGRGVVEIRIGEQPEADTPGGLAVIRSDRKLPAQARQVLAAGVDRDTRIFLLVRERIRRTFRPGQAFVEPQPEPFRIGTGGLLEARLVDQAEIAPAIVAAEAETVVRRKRLQQIETAERVRDDPIPQP